VVCFEQTPILVIRYECAPRSAEERMLTSAECQAQAEQKLAQAETDHRHRKRLITAAEGWIVLARQLRGVEAACTDSETQKEAPQKRGRV
jgi:hypothetical protein